MKNIIQDFCKQHNITEDQFFGRVIIDNDLYLSRLTSIPEGFNPTVGGSLYLSSLTYIPEGFNPTVGGSLDLSSLTSIPEGFNPTVGGSLYLKRLTSIPEGFNPTVGGYLYLKRLTSIPEGFNPTVGGSLDLSSLTSIPEGFNPTVGGYLDLSSLTSIPEGFNPTVGGYLDLRNGLHAEVKRPTEKIITLANQLLFWQGGKYISADGIFAEVLSKKGNTYKLKKVHSTEEFFLVSDGTNHAHGSNLHKATEDYKFKLIAEKLKNDPIKEDTELTVMYYRTLTGACDLGCRQWMEQNNVPFNIVGDSTVEKEPIKAKDLLPLLEKSKPYGYEKFKSLLTF